MTTSAEQLKIYLEVVFNEAKRLWIEKQLFREILISEGHHSELQIEEMAAIALKDHQKHQEAEIHLAQFRRVVDELCERFSASHPGSTRSNEPIQ